MTSTERVRLFRKRHGLSRTNIIGAVFVPGQHQVLGRGQGSPAAQPASPAPTPPDASSMTASVEQIEKKKAA